MQLLIKILCGIYKIGKSIKLTYGKKINSK